MSEPTDRRTRGGSTDAVGAEERWRAIFENVPDAVTEIDAEGRVLATNRWAAPLPASRILGSILYEQVPERLRRGLREAVEEVVRTGQPAFRETRYEGPDGKPTWWITRFIPIRSEGRVVRVLLISSEITPIRMAERALRASEERLALALDAAEYGVWDWDMTTGGVVYSDRWISMLGYARSDVAPDISAWRSLVHPEDLPRTEVALVAHLRGETEAYAAEYRLRCKSGEWLWVLTRGKVVARAPDGRPLRMAGTHRDISERKRADAERERLIAELQHALAEVKTLSGLLPICGSCKKIRDDRGYWQRIEQFLADHSGAQFSHGLCPACAEELKAALDTRPSVKPGI
ncbi:MAG TPA: PAS domain-containing protein [Myxococcota bacterium]|jgi:PAS domain S-box-containing protein|nr:PAS domain-containing protein [Myxococcota bacterium]